MFRNQLGGKAIPNAGFLQGNSALPKHEYGLLPSQWGDETETLPTDCRSAHGWNVARSISLSAIRQYLRIVRRDMMPFLCLLVNGMKVKTETRNAPIFHFPWSAWYNGTHNDGVHKFIHLQAKTLFFEHCFWALPPIPYIRFLSFRASIGFFLFCNATWWFVELPPLPGCRVVTIFGKFGTANHDRFDASPFPFLPNVFRNAAS